jgi:mono/diheme cytochrome c family protein
MERYVLVFATIALSSLLAGAAVAQQEANKKLSTEAMRGKYLAQIAGCNDCHTPGYATSGGKVGEKLWLTGDQLGWRGPWGTTYSSNLRLLVQNLTAVQFMERARSQLRPPMPWFNLREMSDGDVKAIYAYVKELGPAGQPAPRYVPPDQKPVGPFVQFPAPPSEEGGRSF